MGTRGFMRSTKLKRRRIVGRNSREKLGEIIATGKGMGRMKVG
jgi:hypothetical protein